MKSLDDANADVRYQSFIAVSNKCQRQNSEFTAKVLPKLKAAASKEPDPRTKREMQRILKYCVESEKTSVPEVKIKPKSKSKTRSFGK